MYVQWLILAGILQYKIKEKNYEKKIASETTNWNSFVVGCCTIWFQCCLVKHYIYTGTIAIFSTPLHKRITVHPQTQPKQMLHIVCIKHIPYDLIFEYSTWLWYYNLKSKIKNKKPICLDYKSIYSLYICMLFLF